MPLEPELTPWQRTWRYGLVPLLSTAGLRNLAAALERDDPRLLQGTICDPCPLSFNENAPVEGCCPLCWALLDDKKPYEVSVGPLEDRFTATCCQANDLLGEPAGIRHFLHAVDEWSRAELKRHLLPEVLLALKERGEAAAA